MSTAKLQNELNAVAITIDDLLLATDEVHKLLPDDRNWKGRLHVMARLFHDTPRKGLSIEYRLVAMSRMIEAGVLPGWAAPQAADGSVQIAEPVWKAAALEPLILEGKEAYFDQNSFLIKVLSMAEPEGNA